MRVRKEDWVIGPRGRAGLGDRGWVEDERWCYCRLCGERRRRRRKRKEKRTTTPPHRLLQIREIDISGKIALSGRQEWVDDFMVFEGLCYGAACQFRVSRKNGLNGERRWEKSDERTLNDDPKTFSSP